MICKMPKFKQAPNLLDDFGESGDRTQSGE